LPAPAIVTDNCLALERFANQGRPRERIGRSRRVIGFRRADALFVSQLYPISANLRPRFLRLIQRIAWGFAFNAGTKFRILNEDLGAAAERLFPGSEIRRHLFTGRA